MGFFHKSVKDAISKVKEGKYDEARDIVTNHRAKFLKDEELEEGYELETLLSIVKDWKNILSTKEDWEQLEDEKLIYYLNKLEENVIAFKGILKRMIEEEDIVLE